MSLPSISVITPTLNQAGFIRATIESVLSQEYYGLEYQVMDGGSTDGTLEILKSYAGSLSYRSARDKGQSDAINQGWRNTSGELIAWLNSDDLYRPEALKRVGTFFSNHPEVSLVYGDCDLIDSAGQVLQPYRTRPYDYLALLRTAVNYLPQPATFVRRSVLEAEGGLDESLAYLMDFDYWLRIGLHHRAAYLPATLAALRFHDAAKSVAQFGKFAIEQVRVYQKLFARPDLPPEVRSLEKEATGMAYYRAADCAFWAGCLAEARSYAGESIQRLKRPRSLWLWLALGQTGRRLVGKLYPNPYIPGGAL